MGREGAAADRPQCHWGRETQDSLEGSPSLQDPPEVWVPPCPTRAAVPGERHWALSQGYLTERSDGWPRKQTANSRYFRLCVCVCDPVAGGRKDQRLKLPRCWSRRIQDRTKN